MRATEFIIESNQWKLLISAQDKTHWGKELIQLVHTAYKNTNLGSFVNSLNDVRRSDWLVLDWDDCNQPDCAIFYRKNRPDENWIGYKIQGIGHDNHTESKNRVITRVKQQLTKDGWWIESSNAMAKTLDYLGMPAVKNEALLRSIFPNTNLQIIDQTGRYQRKLPRGTTIQEIVFGKPIVKG